MRIASFNINGIKARLAQLTAWLEETAPDVALLQELKSADEGVPREPIEALGYHVETHGQKGFNGVAILSKRPIEDISRGLPGDASDEQSRWIEATISGDTGAVRIASLYLPNGNPAPGPKYDYKLAWMARLEAHAAEMLLLEMPLVLAGDYNVIPEPRDAANPAAWDGDALYRPESRAAWRRLCHLGFLDATRETSQDSGVYSFWDYQAGAWQKDNGIRIDHLLLSPQAADRLTATGIDRSMRGREKPSDHVPVWVELET
ncbi:MAG: exodeoxyribonuclease III [Pseudomonadota bacterium]